MQDADTPEHILDLARLSKKEVRAKYRTTYDTWRNMKQRVRIGALIAPEFEEFSSFLRHVGPRPSIDYSLDRIESANPTYGPGLVRWNDAKGQANNRGTTIFLTVDGHRRPLSEWAELTGQKPDTLRNRKEKGWGDREVVYGRQRVDEGELNPFSWRPWSRPGEKFREWESHYNQYGYRDEVPINFFIRYVGAAHRSRQDELQAMYDADEDNVSSPHYRQRSKEADILHDKLMWAKAMKEEMSRRSNRYKRPPDWTGPARFKKFRDAADTAFDDEY